MNNLDLKVLITKKLCYLRWEFRPTFKIEKQFRNGAIAIEKNKNCKILINQFIYWNQHKIEVKY